jgi:2-polyprenyl-3-methyl-5-hydroxy-6-metoxy-1,4-benzoquinol methylase
MSCCTHCQDAESFFSRRTARRELRRYRRRGPPRFTRRLLDLIPDRDVRERSLLDVGGGIGAIQHEMFARGLARAVHVDASAAYLERSADEAKRRGHRDRVEYRYGDFVDLAPDLEAADIVTLDRVVCCYPDMPRLIRASTARADRVYALSYPRARRATKAVMALGLASDAEVRWVLKPAMIGSTMRAAGPSTMSSGGGSGARDLARGDAPPDPRP